MMPLLGEAGTGAPCRESGADRVFDHRCQACGRYYGAAELAFLPRKTPSLPLCPWCGGIVVSKGGEISLLAKEQKRRKGAARRKKRHREGEDL